MSQAQVACCTCASLLAALPRVCSTSEKPLPDDRRLQCCGRTICGACIRKNNRFRSYCPYCQTSAEPRLKRRPDTRRGRDAEGSGAGGSDIDLDSESETDNDPPPYSAIAQAVNIKFNPTESARPPPPYTPALSTSQQLGSPKDQHSSSPSSSSSSSSSSSTPSPAPYTVHHLRHPPHPTPDSLLSLSLQYGIPPAVLRQHNRLPADADYLLAARHTLLIPTAHITTNPKSSAAPPGTTSSNSSNSQETASLSPRPIEDAAERERKIAIRRFMVACKEADYDTAVVYLEETGFDFALAVQRHREDAEWEARNPVRVGPSSSAAGARGKYYRGRVARVDKGKGMVVTGKGDAGDVNKVGEAKSTPGTGGGGGFLGWWRG
ncbi:uncharacterized protein C8A04DRAFT_9439 [Dichotomopilus funicola]|uniref:LysM domain-containing protein n=1 Tax=Dichotomopilus funicola TaxID=1934379 RepID=A0AAN6VAL4_9PEZI|nr:hypothetical protein C8A04DRAFT_9439 [Dichotomopilus funicola]